MPEQYVATDKRTGFEVQVTGSFPDHPDDRMRIARTTQLFTRLMSTLLDKDETARRLGFRAIETQLELADALIRQEHGEVQRLVRETLNGMGVDESQLREIARRLSEAQGLDPDVARELGRAFGFDPDAEPSTDVESDQSPIDIDPALLEQIEELMAESDDDIDDQPDRSDDPDEPKKGLPS